MILAFKNIQLDFSNTHNTKGNSARAIHPALVAIGGLLP
jgi:hypothetical protein